VTKDSPAPSRTEQRREQILDAAYQVFATKGYAATGIADIANHLKLGHGTVYRYFENKHDILVAVVARSLTRLVQAIGAENPRATNTLAEYRAQVERVGRALTALVAEDPAVAKLLFYEAMGVSAELDEQIQLAWEAAGKISAAFLQNGKDKGFLRADLDVELTALAFNALLFEAGRQIVRASGRDEVQERWVRALTALIFQGISP
jgi:AcrR family transcriptional regulator